MVSLALEGTSGCAMGRQQALGLDGVNYPLPWKNYPNPKSREENFSASNTVRFKIG